MPTSIFNILLLHAAYRAAAIEVSYISPYRYMYIQTKIYFTRWSFIHVNVYIEKIAPAIILCAFLQTFHSISHSHYRVAALTGKLAVCVLTLRADPCVLMRFCCAWPFSYCVQWMIYKIVTYFTHQIFYFVHRYDLFPKLNIYKQFSTLPKLKNKSKREQNLYTSTARDKPPGSRNV